MQVLRVGALPAGALAAAAEFYAKWLGQLNPPPLGEVAAPDSSPLRTFGAPPPEGEDLLIVFPPADHTHTGWRLAAIQQLARDLAPARVNALASADEAAIAAATRYLERAPGLTGQMLALDDAGAGPVVS